MVCCIINTDIQNLVGFFNSLVTWIITERNRKTSLWHLFVRSFLHSLYHIAVWKGLDSSLIITSWDAIYFSSQNFLITWMLSLYFRFFPLTLLFSILTGFWVVHVTQWSGQQQFHVPSSNSATSNYLFCCGSVYTVVMYILIWEEGQI